MSESLTRREFLKGAAAVAAGDGAALAVNGESVRRVYGGDRTDQSMG